MNNVSKGASTLAAAAAAAAGAGAGASASASASAAAMTTLIVTVRGASSSAIVKRTLLGLSAFHLQAGGQVLIDLTGSSAGALVFTTFRPDLNNPTLPTSNNHDSGLFSRPGLKRYRLVQIGSPDALDWPALLPDEHSGGRFKVLMSTDSSSSGGSSSSSGRGPPRSSYAAMMLDDQSSTDRTVSPSLIETVIRTKKALVVADAHASSLYQPAIDGTFDLSQCCDAGTTTTGEIY